MEKVSNYEVMKEFGKTIGKGALFPVKVFYTFPTLTREIYVEKDKVDWTSDTLILPAVFLCSFAGAPLLSGFAGAMIDPNPSSGTGLYIGMGIALATNAVSGLYEIYRNAKNKVQKNAGLEKKCVGIV